ncbi:hypothetical protein [Halobacillus sp. Marseille-Q1614]|uniref:hypothetical protein n=1 Tax=Halobacillus sp. Marseille-Q1614 TaxID=2709134 RepID=UPI00156F94F7|nr:hypothetical protein [Halobacillus sp. Marseille-Q1614]
MNGICEVWGTAVPIAEEGSIRIKSKSASSALNAPCEREEILIDSGYSTLETLSTLCPDFVKIDRHYIQDCHRDSNSFIK